MKNKRQHYSRSRSRIRTGDLQNAKRQDGSHSAVTIHFDSPTVENNCSSCVDLTDVRGESSSICARSVSEQRGIAS
jgi:hypothetical protein